MSKIHTAACAAVAVLLSSSAMAQSAPILSSAQVSLLAAEDEMFQAEIRHDTAAVAREFADEGVFIHADGLTQTKDDFLKSISVGGNLDFHSITPENRVALVSADGTIGVTRAGMKLFVGNRHLGGLYLCVYVKRAGRWQMLDWQSSIAPGSPMPPPAQAK